MEVYRPSRIGWKDLLGWGAKRVYKSPAVRRYAKQFAVNAYSVLAGGNRATRPSTSRSFQVSSRPAGLGVTYPNVGRAKNMKGRRGRVTRKGKSKKRKYRRGKKNKFTVRKAASFKGVTTRSEIGGTHTGSWCSIIGHSVPLYELRKSFFLALVKMLIVKVGINNTSLDKPIQGITAGDTIYVHYTPTQDSWIVPIPSFSYTCIANDNLLRMALKLLAQADLVYQQYPQMQLHYAIFVAGGDVDLNTVRVSLKGCTVRWYADSVLKMQNRTALGASNDETVDLVAQHVEGKSYYGPANGPEPRVTGELNNGALDFKNISFLADQLTGVIGYSGMDSTNPQFELKEPQTKSFFSKVTACGSVKFGPGELKKSHLKYDGSSGLTNFFSSVMSNSHTNPADPSAEILERKRFAKANYRMFMLEKEIETDFSTPAFPVIIAYEVDHTIGMVIDIKSSSWTARHNVIGLEKVEQEFDFPL